MNFSRYTLPLSAIHTLFKHFIHLKTYNMRRSFIFLFPLACFMVIVFLSSCSKDEEETGGQANILFVHGYTFGKNSTLVINDSVIVALTAGYGNFTQYQLVNSGSNAVKVRDNTLDSIIHQSSLNFKKDAYYSIFMANNGQAPKLIAEEDDLGIPDATKTYVRLINLCPNGDNMQLNLTGGATVVSGVAINSASDFIALDPGKLNFTIVGANSLLSSITNFSMLAGKKYSILMTGFVGQTPKATHNIIVNK